MYKFNDDVKKVDDNKKENDLGLFSNEVIEKDEKIDGISKKNLEDLRNKDKNFFDLLKGENDGKDKKDKKSEKNEDDFNSSSELVILSLKIEILFFILFVFVLKLEF